MGGAAWGGEGQRGGVDWVSEGAGSASTNPETAQLRLALVI